MAEHKSVLPIVIPFLLTVFILVIAAVFIVLIATKGGGLSECQEAVEAFDRALYLFIGEVQMGNEEISGADMDSFHLKMVRACDVPSLLFP